MKKVLVLGAGGSLGTRLVHWLDYVHAGAYEVTAIDRQFPEKEFKSRPKVKYHIADLSQSNALYGLFWYLGTFQFDVVIQAAATVQGVTGFHTNGYNTITNDLAVQANVLNFLKTKLKYADEKSREDFRFVYISSSMVYETLGIPDPQGGIPSPTDLNQHGKYTLHEEEVHGRVHTGDGVGGFKWQYWNPEPCRTPSTDYGLSKLVGERMVIAANKDWGLPYTIWRPFNIITPEEVSDASDIGISHVFADFIRTIVDQKKTVIPVIGSGNQIRCFTWIDDVVSAMIRFMNSPETLNGAFNLARQEPVSMRGLAELILDEAIDQGAIDFPYGHNPKLIFETKQSYIDDVVVRYPSILKMEKLGWKANTSLRRSVRKCVAAAIKRAS